MSELPADLETAADEIIEDIQGPQSYRLIAPIYYKGTLIDQDAVNQGISIELDAEEADMLRQAGCIE